MNKQTIFEKIKIVRQEPNDAEADVGQVLRELKISAPIESALA